MENDSLSKNERAEFLAFLGSELLLFGIQIVIFFIVAILFSYFFSSEGRLVEYVNSKVSDKTLGEFGFTLLAITIVLGALSFVSAAATSKTVQQLSREVLLEAPRTIYFFGSTIASTGFAVSLYIQLYPPREAIVLPSAGFFEMAVLIALLSFSYGFGLKALLTRGLRKSPGEK